MTLEITDTASTVVKTIAAQTPGTEEGGIRISGSTDGDATAFDLAVAAEPAPGDAVVESDGAKVFLDPAAAQVLDESVLDAQVTDDGQVRFAVGAQEPGPA